MSSSQARPSRRPQPERSCIACRRARPKRELVRIVRTPTGTVEVDVTSRRSGRGAYLCRDRACWEAALKGSAVEHSLHLTGRLPLEVRERLFQEGMALLAQAPLAGTGVPR